MYLTLLNLLCSNISLISGQITYPDMRWSRCGRITKVGLYNYTGSVNNQPYLTHDTVFLFCLLRSTQLPPCPVKTSQNNSKVRNTVHFQLINIIIKS